MEYSRYFWIKVILLPAIVTGINFSFDKERVLLGSTGTLTMTCDITETDVESIYLIQIKRIKSTSLSGEEKSHWDTLALMEISKNESPTLGEDIAASTKDYVAGGSWDSTTPGNTYLTVSMNMEQLVCDDARYYMCDLSYKTSTSDNLKPEKNATFSAYVMPQVTSLDVKKNSYIVQGSSPTDIAAVNVGDELELKCNANIGSLPGTIIRWNRTSETATTNEFIGYQPPQGTYSDGTAISDNQCGYTRVATIKYNATAADANRQNYLAFECYVTVSGDPYGNSLTSENNPRFYAEVAGSGSGAPITQSSLQTSSAPTSQTNLQTSSAPTSKSHQTSGNDQISVNLGVIVGNLIASMTFGVFIGVVFTWVLIHKIRNVQGPGVQIQPNREESREISSVITASTTQSPYESLEHGTGTSHTYAGLQQS